ncbi:MAG: DNA-binding transcriptional regulator [Rhodothermaceae bacterium]|nr:MAG: DNA-binding transcriptional regulator [Rhodothermaceae bacterium]
MDRTDRLLAILHELKATRWLRAADLADLFEVSTRTIYRDMQALGEAGVPLQAVPGKGYSLDEGAFLPPLVFSHSEAVMLLLGADFMARHFEVHYRTAARSAAWKVEAALPEALRETVRTLQESIRFVPVNAFDNPAERAVLQDLREALAAERAVRFTYPSRAGAPAEAHHVHPYGLVHGEEGWTLLGLDRAAGQVRTFRLARMQDVAVTDEAAPRPAAYRAAPHGEAAQTIEVLVCFDPDVAAWVRDVPGFFVEDTEQRPDGLYVTLRVRREAEVLPWLLSWGGHVRVLAPSSLRRRLAQEAERIAAHYREATPRLL